ncbi:MAG: phosphonate C-P lyase system protein PhnH [Paracoccaceae bacterium]|jgi:alpha-D-ribose 1-methylphosphonate 5-triphosphate synthase subunit PhnH|nr:phosphonate C-P lyase system protein PhnH [Paracoccaceae bacterium]MDO7654754.1 phosphonate C-P lyase system protein PhnH [Paracoccaceae bacterium]
MNAHALKGGFSNPAHDAAFAFRAILDAMARPGLVVALAGASAPAPLSNAAAAAVLTLVDATTPLYLAPSHDNPNLRAWLTFHCNAPFCAENDAQFALGTWADLILYTFPKGTPLYPDRSTTLIIDHWEAAVPNTQIHGPGIETTTQIALPDIGYFAANHRLSPLGLDFIFTKGDALFALPRSTAVQEF